IESATEFRFHPQQRKVIRRDNKQPHPRWLGWAGQIIFVEPGRRNVFENSGLPEILPFGLRYSDIPCAETGQIGLDTDQLLWLRVGQRTQQRRVYHAKNRSCRSNTEGNRQDNNGSEPGRFPEHAQTEAKVLQENVDEIAGELVTA